METLYLKLAVASPISIGCDEVYEPTGFVVDEEARELISFDTHEFLQMLDKDSLQRFSAICAKGTISSLLELMRFMRQNRQHAHGERCELTPAFLDHYRQVLGMKNNPKDIQQGLNNFKIGRTAFNAHTNLPVIPGSSIKGAIRTAVLNLRNNGNTFPSFRGRQANRKLQEHLLKYQTQQLASDPFRLVKVSDFVPAGDFRRRVLYAVNLKKRPSERESQGPPQILEVIESGAEFIGTISIQKPGRKSRVQAPVTREEILQAMKQFYGDENRRENHDLSRIYCQPLQLDSQGLPLRVGRHSGAECVTVAGHRAIKVSPPRKKPLKFQDHATTLWLAAESKKPGSTIGLRPFGWTVLSPLKSGEMETMKKSACLLEQKRLEMIRNRTEKQRIESERRARQAVEEKKERLRREDEARRKAEEEIARREAELAAMPDDKAWLVRREQDNNWKEDNSALLADAESFFENFSAPGIDALDMLGEWLSKKWPGIMQNPEATKGKKKKAKYKERPSTLAKRILKLQEDEQ